MTREEIINQGRPTEPHCFDTGREEQWYSLGLYDGATANPWHTVADGDFPKKSGDYLCSDGEEFIVAYYSRASRRFHNILERYGGDYDDWIKYWMEIPILQDKMNTSSALSKMER